MVALALTVGISATASADPILVIATVKVRAGTEAAFKEAAELILAPTHAEAGSLSYGFYQSPTEPSEFTTVEVWRSQADIDQHMKLPFMQSFFKTVGGLFAPGYPVLKSYQQFGTQP
jgi:quinol monooxygenase YgiN